MKGKRITVKEAAAILGMTPDYIHYHMRVGDLPIGHVMKAAKGTRKQYIIFEDLVKAFTGERKEA